MRKGNSILEFVLIAGVVMPLLLSVLDGGLCVYGLLAVENAARAAASRNASGPESAADQATACAIARSELKGLPNVDTSSANTCSSAPLEVTSVLCNDTTPCTGTTASADGGPAVSVTIRYTIPRLFLVTLGGPSSIVRSCQMKLMNTD